MIDALIAAARLARMETQGNRFVEISVTESGFMARVEGRSEGRRHSFSLDLDWIEFEQNPALLENAVRLIADRITPDGLPRSCGDDVLSHASTGVR